MRCRVLLLSCLLGLTPLLAAAQKKRPPAPPYDLIRQGGSNTCWLLASMEALQYRGVDLSKRVKTDGHGHYQVRLFNYDDLKNGGNGRMHGEVIRLEFDGNPGGTDPVIKKSKNRALWVVAVHRAAILAVKKWDPTQSIDNPHGGDARHAFATLTGREATTISTEEKTARAILEAALRRRAAVVLNTKGGMLPTLVGGHSYAVLKSGDEGVLLHNPWGDEKTYPWDLIAKEGDSFQILETQLHRPANLLVNGSFEDGPAAADFLPLDPGSGAIKGWKVTRGQIDYCAEAWSAAHGYRSLDLHGSPGFGGIEQTFPTQKGHRYRVTFSLAANPDGQVRTKRLGVSAAGQKATFAFDATGKTAANMGWVTKEWEFDASGPKTTLEFYTLEDKEDCCGPALDDVRVVPVAGINLLVNGSFEDGADINGWVEKPRGSTDITGWRVIDGLLLTNGLWQHADGGRSLFLHSPGRRGGIEQTFSTRKGQCYRVTFSLAANSNGARWTGELNRTRIEVAAAGQARQFTFDCTGRTPYDMGWVTREWEFVARDDRTNLAFSTAETDAGFWHGPTLDNVRVWPVTGPNLVVNGSFEDGPEFTDKDDWFELNSGSTAIKGWTVTGGLLVTGRLWKHADGLNSILLNSPSRSGGVEQAFPTKKGQRYRVSFALSANPNNGRWPPELTKTGIRVSAAGKSKEFAFDCTGKLPRNMGWVTREWEFAATGDRTTLAFATVETDKGFWHGPTLDKVRVVAVPPK